MQPHQKHVIMWLYSEQQQHEKKLKWKFQKSLTKMWFYFGAKLNWIYGFFIIFF